MALILISELIPAKSSSGTAPASSGYSSEEYRKQLEKRLSEVISRISGVGECEVLVTLENGSEKIYLEDISSSEEKNENIDGENRELTEKSQRDQEIVIIDGEAGEEGIVSKEIEPQIRGVVVVCDGGDDTVVNLRVVEAVTTALRISSARVCVVPIDASTAE